MSKLSNFYKLYLSAFKAGWIAHRCPMCVVDNVNEEIIPCMLHRTEIARLNAINQAAQ